MGKQDKSYLVASILLVAVVMSVFIACAEPAQSPLPSVQPDDAKPLTAISGLVTIDAYDGKINLKWSRSAIEDFGQYNIYIGKSEIADTSRMAPAYQIRDYTTTTYQVTGLETGTKYYFAVTATNKKGNENKIVACVTTTSTPMPGGISDPDISVDVYQSESVCVGTTLLGDNYRGERPRIIELNLLGEIIWQYLVPNNLRRPGSGINPGFDIELLSNTNVMFTSPGSGVYEIDRKGTIIWSYSDQKVSHDADRLPNGNTLVVFGDNDQKNDAQIKEVNPKGVIVWAWYAKNSFDKPPYTTIYDQGWTHTNAVSRLSNGNTLISLRNFNFIVEVDPQGAVIRTIGEGILDAQHDPEMLPNGNILMANHNRIAAARGEKEPQRALEIDPKTGKIAWQLAMPEPATWPVRDANRLPNGNTLIVGSTKIIEVTPDGQIVWQLKYSKDFGSRDPLIYSGRGFYKAERISIPK